MLGERIRTDWLSRRRSEDQVTGFWIEILRTHFSVQIMKKGNDPVLQLDWTTASQTLGIREAPFPVQPPDATNNANRLSCPVYILPLETQVFTRAHTSRECDCEYWPILCALCGLEQCPRLFNGQRPHFVSNLLRYFESIGRNLEQQAPPHCLLHRTFHQHMRVTDSGRGQAPLAQNSFTENRSDVPVQHALVILEGIRAYSRSYGCLKPSVNVFVQRYLGPFQIAAQVTLSQFSC